MLINDCGRHKRKKLCETSIFIYGTSTGKSRILMDISTKTQDTDLKQSREGHEGHVADESLNFITTILPWISAREIERFKSKRSHPVPIAESGNVDLHESTVISLVDSSRNLRKTRLFWKKNPIHQNRTMCTWKPTSPKKTILFGKTYNDYWSGGRNGLPESVWCVV